MNNYRKTILKVLLGLLVLLALMTYIYSVANAAELKDVICPPGDPLCGPPCDPVTDPLCGPPPEGGPPEEDCIGDACLPGGNDNGQNGEDPPADPVNPPTNPTNSPSEEEPPDPIVCNPNGGFQIPSFSWAGLDNDFLVFPRNSATKLCPVGAGECLELKECIELENGCRQCNTTNANPESGNAILAPGECHTVAFENEESQFSPQFEMCVLRPNQPSP